MAPNNKEMEAFALYLTTEIPDFTKRKNGLPDMRCPLNKKYMIEFKKRNILEQNKKDALCINCEQESKHYQDEVLKMTEKELELFSKIEEEPCVICGDIMEQDCCKLKCNHKFCASCFAQHSRVSDKCPLCRTSVSGQDVKIMEKMNTYISNGIISEETFRSRKYIVLNDPDNMYLCYEAIDREINDFQDMVMAFVEGHIEKKVLDEYKIEMMKMLFINQRTLMIQSITQTAKFYNEQM